MNAATRSVRPVPQGPWVRGSLTLHVPHESPVTRPSSGRLRRQAPRSLRGGFRPVDAGVHPVDRVAAQVGVPPVAVAHHSDRDPSPLVEAVRALPLAVGALPPDAHAHEDTNTRLEWQA